MAKDANTVDYSGWTPQDTTAAEITTVYVAEITAEDAAEITTVDVAEITAEDVTEITTDDAGLTTADDATADEIATTRGMYLLLLRGRLRQ
ncbi:hypothetical protein ACOMHN_039514 [Nucella lapillus]